MLIHREYMRKARAAMRWGLALNYADGPGFGPKKGTFIFDMRDAKTGEQLAYWEKDVDCSGKSENA